MDLLTFNKYCAHLERSISDFRREVKVASPNQVVEMRFVLWERYIQSMQDVLRFEQREHYYRFTAEHRKDLDRLFSFDSHNYLLNRLNRFLGELF